MKQLTALLLIVFSLASYAVTKEEMEQARAITAKQYLRYANNGSDYLDKLEVKSLAELEGKLKAKEKDNIVVFKKVSVPSDYASWDKDKLVEYWSATFFRDGSLSEEGKKARSSVKKKISEMKVSAPAPETPAELSSSEEPVPQIAPEDIQEAPSAVDAALAAKEESIAAAQTPAEEEVVEKGESNTAIYVVILILLIAVVITLVVYASRVFKNSGLNEERSRKERERENSHRESEHRRALESLSDTLADKEAELRTLRLRCEKAEKSETRLRAELEDALREKETLRDRIDFLNSQLASLGAVSVPKRKAYAMPLSEIPGDSQLKGASAPSKRQKFYLPPADAGGIFGKAEREFRPGVSVFMLTTSDGITGTFDIVDDGDLIEEVISSPARTIANAVSARLPENPDEVTGIQTESAGTAVFEDGRWKVVRKARLRFER